jgi:hypothetical protein
MGSETRTLDMIRLDLGKNFNAIGYFNWICPRSGLSIDAISQFMLY